MSRAHSDADLRATLEALKAAGGSRRKAASALGVSESTLKTRLQVARQRGLDVPAAPSSAGALGSVAADRLGRISELLERSGIPLDEVGRVIPPIKLKAWQGLTKDADGNVVVTDLHGEEIGVVPKWMDGPAWPVIQQAPAVTVAPVRVNVQPVRAAGWRVAVVLPDAQIGYWRDPETGVLVPTHDEQALAVALDITCDADPDVVVLLGDYLDFPELSKYRLQSTFVQTTQPAINRAARLMASLRARVRPECEIVWIAGNHEERMPRYATDNAAASFGLKRANAPHEWPVMSVPYLCRLDEYRVEFLPGYPANKYRINDNLRCIHGDKVRSGGSTAQAMLKDIRHSTILGHIHRIEHQAVTLDTNAGARTYHAVSPGCLCKTDGSVPGHESGYGLTGKPIATVNNWAQGMLVIPFEPGDGRFRFEQVEIWSGHALWRGREYVAPGDITEAA